jgi:hypothetical protein
MCEECSTGLAGKPKKAKIGEHGYSDGKTFDKSEDWIKNQAWKGFKVATGATTGYVLAKTLEESSTVFSENKGIAAASQLTIGLVSKSFMPIDWANSIPDNICNGFITRGGVNLFRGFAEGFAKDFNISGYKDNLRRLQGYVPQMPKRAA